VNVYQRNTAYLYCTCIVCSIFGYGSLERGWMRRCHEARDVIVTHTLTHSYQALTEHQQVPYIHDCVYPLIVIRLLLLEKKNSCREDHHILNPKPFKVNSTLEMRTSIIIFSSLPFFPYLAALWSPHQGAVSPRPLLHHALSLTPAHVHLGGPRPLTPFFKARSG
jgi:hypothetical protein